MAGGGVAGRGSGLGKRPGGLIRVPRTGKPQLRQRRSEGQNEAGRGLEGAKMPVNSLQKRPENRSKMPNFTS